MDKDDAERSQKMIEEQITRALATKGDVDEVYTHYMYLCMCLLNCMHCVFICDHYT